MFVDEEWLDEDNSIFLFSCKILRQKCKMYLVVDLARFPKYLLLSKFDSECYFSYVVRSEKFNNLNCSFALS